MPKITGSQRERSRVSTTDVLREHAGSRRDDVKPVDTVHSPYTHCTDKIDIQEQEVSEYGRQAVAATTKQAT